MLLVPAVMMNSRGNALIMALGCAALVGAVSIEIWKHLEQKRQLGNHSALKDEANLIMENFTARLQNPDDCSHALAGEFIVPGTRSDITWRSFLDPDAEAGVRLTALQVETAAEDDFRTEILDVNGVSIELRRYPVFLHAVVADAAGEWVHSQRSARPFYVWALPPPPVGTGQIQSCFGRDSSGALCNELGGYFIPHLTAYDQSCRQSLKTLRRVNGTLTPLANCRAGGMAAKAAACRRFGVAFGGFQLNSHAAIAPSPGNMFLCQVCQ